MAAKATAVVTDKMAEETFCATLATDSDMKVGMRVLAEPMLAGKKQTCKGTVMFIGTIVVSAGPPAVGVYVGVHLDEPVGNNDGSIGDKKYFARSTAYLSNLESFV